MLDDEHTSSTDEQASSTDQTTTVTADVKPAKRSRRRAASRPAGPPPAADPFAAPSGDVAGEPSDAPASAPAQPAAVAPASGGALPKSPASDTSGSNGHEPGAGAQKPADGDADTAPKATGRRRTSRAKPAPEQSDSSSGEADTDSGRGAATAFVPQFQAPQPVDPPAGGGATEASDDASDADDAGDGNGNRRRRSRGGRGRRKGGQGDQGDGASGDSTGSSGGDRARGDAQKSTKQDTSGGGQSSGGKKKADPDKSQGGTSDAGDSDAGNGDDSGSSSRRRRRRRSRGGSDDKGSSTGEDAITSVQGSTRIEAKKQRRREGREAGRRRAPILSESEFLARRESVDRVMAIRQRGDTTQLAVLEDDVLVEHYVALKSHTSMIGNVYLGRVQNVLPSMEAAFIDIGKGRNGVLYAGEVNWNLVGDKNAPRRIENALKPGQTVLVQVSKDPVGHKGARLTAQINLPGRFLVFVPGGGTSGISRKLPDTERTRLKALLKEILPEHAGVIVRTAAEGASEEDLTRDVTRLTARWDDIEKKSGGSAKAPTLLYEEPDTTLKVVRDLFTEDFAKLVISGDDAWDMVHGYVSHVAPDLLDRVERFDGDGDVFTAHRIDEQISKALDRKVWLPSGGSLILDRTEAMTVVDVNTGKFTGSGGNLEETVTKNNLEAAEEIVRQLRLRDIGGIIVVDFIDMVLESNRDLVVRRLVECLGRDRTRHQVAEVTSLGLVQMTRKRISTGLVESFSHTCESCHGRGVVIEDAPIEPKKSSDNGGRGGRGGGGRRRRGGRGGDDDGSQKPTSTNDRPKEQSGGKKKDEPSGNGKASAKDEHQDKGDGSAPQPSDDHGSGDPGDRQAKKKGKKKATSSAAAGDASVTGDAPAAEPQD